jgi:hypothetical protein
MFAKSSIDPKKKHKFTAHIGYDQNWWSYYNHYKSAIDFLVEGIEGNLPVNTVSFPLLFSIRHCLELGFKANILKLETISEAHPNLSLKGGKSHSLEHLYSIFEAHLTEIQKKANIEHSLKETITNYLIETDKLKSVLHTLDKGSYNFRYPVDTDGIYNFEWNTELNVDEIVEAFYKIQPFIVFTDAVLYEHGVFGLE